MPVNNIYFGSKECDARSCHEEVTICVVEYDQTGPIKRKAFTSVPCHFGCLHHLIRNEWDREPAEHAFSGEIAHQTSFY